MDLRLFIALELPDRFLQDLERDLASLRRSHPEFRWTNPGNQHLTLAFLGNTPEQGIPLIIEALERAVRNWRQREKPEITAGSAGTARPGSIAGPASTASPPTISDSSIWIQAEGLYLFPQRKPASVLATGIGIGAEEICRLAAALETELFTIKTLVPLDDYAVSRRPFIPHITVARGGRKPIHLDSEERQISLKARGEIGYVGLISSLLQRGGPVYTVQGRYHL